MAAITHAELARQSAQAVVPYVMDLLEPRSVCDVGCGRGIWLAVFQEHGAEQVIGADSADIDPSHLQIDAADFVVADLDQGVPIEGRFDLAVSLEVAEHLSSDAAERLVADLVRLAPAVLFSAAVPGQGGLDHTNEQWPAYWQSLFGRHDYLAIDCIRPRIWDSEEVAFWYRQNTLLFAHEDLIDSHEGLKREYEASAGRSLSIVHPKLFEIVLRRLEPWRRVRDVAEAVEAGRLDEGELEEQIGKVVRRYAERARARARADRRFT